MKIECKLKKECVADKKKCINCKRAYHLKDYFKAYESTCPRGYTDCIYDPAYIKYHNPEWYKELFGNATPEEAAEKCRKKFKEDPNEEEYCYDDEDR